MAPVNRSSHSSLLSSRRSTGILISALIKLKSWSDKWLPSLKSSWNTCIPWTSVRSNPFSGLSRREIEEALQPLFPRIIYDCIPHGVGFCNTADCEEFRRHKYLVLHEGPYVCPTCEREGWARAERGIRVGKRGELFREVRIRYALDVLSRELTKEAIVRDDSLGPEHNTYIYESYGIYADRYALQAAEALLYLINQDPTAGDDELIVPKIQEIVLNMDAPREEFRQQLHDLGCRLRANKFLQKDVVSQFSADPIPKLRRTERSGSQ